jgi:hypothetical protein
MTRTVFLNNLLEQSLKDAHGNWFIEWRPFKGWYAVPDSCRYWGDNGEFLGENWKRAVRGIRDLFE